MDDVTPIRGQCLCGEVRFEITPPTNWCAHCHCSMCRRAHGASYVTWVGVPEGQFRITAGSERLVRYQSSGEAWRRFCGTCGSSLFFEGTRWPSEVHVAVGNLLDPLDRAPKGHAYFDDRAAWVAVNDGLPRFGGPSGNTPLD
jgi:hypothetical protein